MAPDATATAIGPPASAECALGRLSPSLRQWFPATFGSPTTAQCLAWPSIAAGRNLLLSAPTGSGKTLAAFVPILDRLLETPGEMLRCLYIAPLKALAADACKNVTAALQPLAPFLPETTVMPQLALRTGDTSSYRRRRQRLLPPDILLTTPESLALLLTHTNAFEMFATLRWIIVDEVHAFAAGKRGADLALSLERLQALARQPVQRIGLSATCSPLGLAAKFLAGAGADCEIAEAPTPSSFRLAIEPLEIGDSGFVAALVERLVPELARQRTTLIFTNTRSLAERLTWALKRRLPAWDDALAVHHSSLGAARRRDVEQRLKDGELRAVVTSTSLELGIDIGSVDGVVLVHPPGGAVRLMQRLGRAGHRPGQVRSGLVLTTTPAELLETAVTAAAGRAGQWESLRLPEAPLDVLCQHLLGMATERPWQADEAFEVCRKAYSFRDLSRQDFDDCLDYLCGRGADGESWLPPRLMRFGDEFSILDRRTAQIVRQNIGTLITDEPRPVLLDAAPGLRELRTVGQVDEWFADGLKPGDRFLLDGRCLEMLRTEDRALIVEEVIGAPVPARWSGAGPPLSHDLARRLYVLRAQAADALRDGPRALTELLKREYALAGPAIAELIALFQRQECVSEVPDDTSLLVEVVPADDSVDHYIHTPLNRAGNDALARVAVWRLTHHRHCSASSQVADLGFVLSVEGRPELTADDLRFVLSVANFDADLTQAVTGSQVLRERFRGVALTALMLLRNPLGKRVRTGGNEWAERHLFDQVHAANPNFVLLRQARREVHEDWLDGPAARTFLEELPRRALRWRWLPGVSPLAEHWTQAAEGPVDSAESPVEALTRLHAMLMTRAV
jgi:ATP-dependent Lhr-like helicase